MSITDVCAAARTLITGSTPSMMSEHEFWLAEHQRPLTDEEACNTEHTRTLAVWPAADPQAVQATYNCTFHQNTQTINVDIFYHLCTSQHPVDGLPSAWELAGQDALEIQDLLVESLRYPAAPTVSRVRHTGRSDLIELDDTHTRYVQRLQFEVLHATGGT